MQSSNPIDLTVDLGDLLPQAVIDEWLPDENKSILFLFQEFNHYPPHSTNYLLPSNFQTFLHSTPAQGFDYTDLIQIPPPAHPNISMAYQDAIKQSKYPILSVTLQPQFSNPVTLPKWIFEYWKEIGRAVNI